MRKSLRVWLISSLAIVLLTTATGCNQSGNTSVAASPATASPSGSPSASPSNSPSPSASSSPSPGGSPDALAGQFPGLPRLQGKATIVMTIKGAPITIEVDGTNAPITAGNFVDLVDKKVYDGLVFHRVVRQPTPFVVQGGDPSGKDPNVPVDKLGTGSYTDPATGQARMIPLEIKPAKDGPTIYSKTLDQAGLSDGPKLKHTRGAVAMARSADPNSASAQFYFALSDLDFLNGSYAVFGYVTQGMDVVDKIQQSDRIDEAKVLQGLENLKRN
jgi:peptidyl-prolyl cis-trans isomerase B (cyclophilin B)